MLDKHESVVTSYNLIKIGITLLRQHANKRLLISWSKHK